MRRISFSDRVLFTTWLKKKENNILQLKKYWTLEKDNLWLALVLWISVKNDTRRPIASSSLLRRNSIEKTELPPSLAYGRHGTLPESGTSRARAPGLRETDRPATNVVRPWGTARRYMSPTKKCPQES